MKLAFTLALVGGTAIAAQLLPPSAYAGMPGDPPTPTVADLARQAASQAVVAPPAMPAPVVQPAVQMTARDARLRTDLAVAQRALSRDLRVVAERRLDWAATDLLNAQQAVRGGDQQPTPYDTSAADVIAAYHAARQGDLATAKTMVNGAIQALPTSG